MKAIVSALLMIGLLAAHAGAQTPAAAKRIKFGIQTGQQDVTYKEIVAIWKEAEALGFDSAWNFDHFMPIRGDEDGPCLEAWTLLGALADADLAHPHRHAGERQHLPQPGAAGEDGDDDRPDQQRPLRARHRRRLVREGASRLRLPVLHGEGARRPPRRSAAR